MTPPDPNNGESETRTETADKPAVDDRALTVMQVLPALGNGGVERGTIDLTDALVTAGHRAIVVSSGGPRVAEVERLGGEHITLPVDRKNPYKMWRNIGALQQIIADNDVDIVHARSRVPAWSSLYAARRAGCTFVTTFHGTYNFGNLLKKAYNSVMARGDRVIAVSEFIARHIIDNYKIDPGRITIIHRGTDRRMFHPDAVTAARKIQLAQQWRLPSGAEIALLPGRLTRWKGQLEFIRAIAELGRDDIVAVLCGSDQGRTAYSDEIRALITELGLDRQVRVVGDCNDMPAAYALASVVVSASNEPEAFGRVAVEAQALGRPVIATDHGGATETVLDGVTGWRVPVGDISAMATAIGQAIDLTAEERAELAEQAQANVDADFTRDLMCARTLDFYNHVLGRD